MEWKNDPIACESSKNFKNIFAPLKNRMEKGLKELIREELIVDEQEIIRRILPRVKQLIGFTKEGKIIFMTDTSKIPKIYHVLL